MVKIRQCDRCGSIDKVEENELIEFFDGSLAIADADLCEDCFQILAKFLEGFAIKQEGVEDGE